MAHSTAIPEMAHKWLNGLTHPVSGGGRKITTSITRTTTKMFTIMIPMVTVNNDKALRQAYLLAYDKNVNELKIQRITIH
jgi:hypothetical protein